MTTPTTFDDLCNAAQGKPEPGKSFVPYGYQRRIADEGLPELLEIPTGCGKTLAVILGWLWRRLFHPDSAVRESTPRRLVYVLPQRVLVEQVAGEVSDVLGALGLTDQVGQAVLMGGEGRISGAWRLEPEREAILVATQDMALSGALNRRYGESRWTWPIDFGLLNNDCAYVFDELQLMGPGLPTSRQLAGLREVLGTAVDCSSTWMSATVDSEALATIDRPKVASTIVLDDDDRGGTLSSRLNAQRTIHQIQITDPKKYAAEIASALLDAHRPGTRMIAVANTVRRATELYRAICRAKAEGPDVVLIHSRFRPPERAHHLGVALADVDPSGPGTIVVTTQVLEAGVDISSDVLFTEAALWSSVVQRAGRCNRDGSVHDARLLWCAPPKGAPYDDGDVANTVATLVELEGQALTTEKLAVLAPKRAWPEIYQSLRRRDLLELFDTLADLSGSDVDISRFIRDADDRELAVAWVDLGEDPNDPLIGLPDRAQRCPVPISDVKEIVALQPLYFDHLVGRWILLKSPRDIRPGMVLLADSTRGGYDLELGWAPKSRHSVPPIGVDDTEPPAPGLSADNTVGDDPMSVRRKRWVSLVEHLTDVEAEARDLLASIDPSGLEAKHCDAAIVAARLHDLGKVHPVFQDTLKRSGTADELVVAADSGPPWAKSGGSAHAHHARRHFRHELASALALLDDAGVLLDDVEERDLAIYLVAAHHGRIRLGFRPLPNESAPPGDLADRSVALGIVDGEVLPQAEVPGGVAPPCHLDLSVMQLGAAVDGRPSWSQRMLPLRDRADLGPFRVGFLEAIVRMADWRASAAADQKGTDS